MKPQIATGNKNVASAYGEIMLRAWKSSHQTSLEKANNFESDAQNAIEDILQNLFHDAVHAADKKYFKSLRIILSSFHDAKYQKSGVDSMLLRTYG